jgi:hypothetical protein
MKRGDALQQSTQAIPGQDVHTGNESPKDDGTQACANAHDHGC